MSLVLRKKWLPEFAKIKRKNPMQYLSFYMATRPNGKRYARVFVWCVACQEGSWKDCREVKRGKACTFCEGRSISQKECKKRCEASQPEKGYKYNRVLFKGVDVKIEIICPIHGAFWQRPADHWRGIGCEKCGNGSYSWDVYKEKAKAKHNGKYTYPDQEWKETRDTIRIVCPVHGEFTQVSSIHLVGQGCWACAQEAQRKTLEEVLTLCTKAHGNYYNYSLVVYTGKQEMIKIICPIHGVFEQRAEDHYGGHGCRKCNTPPGRLCEKNIERDVEKYKGTAGHLYLLKCNLGEEAFYKIGITGDAVKYRFGTKRKMPYDYVVIQDKSMNMYDAFYLEQHIKDTLKEYRYYPKIKFGGHTEALKIEALPQIESILEETLKQ